jgi:hypothetical protein
MALPRSRFKDSMCAPADTELAACQRQLLNGWLLERRPQTGPSWDSGIFTFYLHLLLRVFQLAVVSFVVEVRRNRGTRRYSSDL